MNKKEVLEIRKQFTPVNCAITRICGCYVDHEKNKKLQTKEAFLSLLEEEAFKYFDIFRKALSGSIGKNLLNLDYSIKNETWENPHGTLVTLKDTKLLDDDIIEQFYDSVIDNYDYNENYYIILIHGMYDIPGKASDGEEMFDASDEVYDFIMCSICPVKLSKAGLSYDAQDNRIENRARDWVVGKPDKGFLFPAFNDRSTDIHSALYYTRKSDEIHPEMIENVLGAEMITSADVEKDLFLHLIEDVLGDKCDFETVRNIHETLNDLIEDYRDSPEPLSLGKSDIRKIFGDSGVTEECMEKFDSEFDFTFGRRKTVLASNIAETKEFTVKTPNLTIKASPDRSDMVETKVVDGRQCIVITVDDHVTVNGIEARTVKQ